MDWLQVMSRRDYSAAEKAKLWKEQCDRIGFRYVAEEAPHSPAQRDLAPSPQKE